MSVQFPANPTDQERGSYTSASNAQADSLCPARHLFQIGIQDVGSRDASFGDNVHAYLAGTKTDLTAEEESVAESCLSIEQKVIAQYFGAGAKVSGVKEKRLWVQWPDGLRHSGQLDRFYRSGTKGMVIEFKSLSGDVAVSPKNMQLRDQVCLADANIPLLSEIAVVVIQPLVTHSPELCIYTKADIVKAREQMYHRVAASNKEGQLPVPGEVQCKFCKAKASCKAYQRFAGSLVPISHSLVDIAVNEWTPDQRKQFCDTFSIAEKWLNSCWDAMEKGATSDPLFVPGYQMVDGQSRSKIKNLQQVFERFSSSGGTLEQFMACATITKKDLNEITRSATKKKGKSLADAVELIIGSDVEVSPAKKSLKAI